MNATCTNRQRNCRPSSWRIPENFWYRQMRLLAQMYTALVAPARASRRRHRLVPASTLRPLKESRVRATFETENTVTCGSLTNCRSFSCAAPCKFCTESSICSLESHQHVPFVIAPRNRHSVRRRALVERLLRGIVLPVSNTKPLGNTQQKRISAWLISIATTMSASS